MRRGPVNPAANTDTVKPLGSVSSWG